MWIGWAQRIQKFGAKYAWRVTLFATWFLYLTIVASADLWSYVGVPHMFPYFADLNYILSGCVLFCGYPSTWLWLGKVGLGPPDASWLGASIDIAFAILVVRLINPKDLWQFIVATLVVFSPAVTLAMERCNPDIIIFCLLSCAALLVSN